MKRIVKLLLLSLKLFVTLPGNFKMCTISIILCSGALTSAESQTFFSRNANVVFDKKKSDAFIKATPEIALKADYYNISRAVLETFLILQSNSGTTTSDDRYYYGRVKVHPELGAYPVVLWRKNKYFSMVRQMKRHYNFGKTVWQSLHKIICEANLLYEKNNAPLPYILFFPAAQKRYVANFTLTQKIYTLKTKTN